jgi:hypothetical protein
MFGLLFMIIRFSDAATNFESSPTISSDAVRFPTQLLKEGDVDIHPQSKSISTTKQTIHPIVQGEDAGKLPTQLNPDPNVKHTNALSPNFKPISTNPFFLCRTRYQMLQCRCCNCCHQMKKGGPKGGSKFMKGGPKGAKW